MSGSIHKPQASRIKALLSSSAIHTNAVVGLMLVLAMAWGLRPALHGVHVTWSDKYGHFSHGYLVLAMALWIAWTRWRTEPPIPTAPVWLALPALAALVVAMAASEAMSISTITQSLLPLVLLAAIAAVYGWRAARRYFWPVCFLYAALPIWWLINTPLQQLTAFVANVLVRWTAVPAFVEGNSFHLPAGTVQIAAGCSGLAYLNAAVALALFQGLQYLGSWRDRLKLLAVAVALALAFNWLRVYSLIVIAYATDMQHYLIRVDHLTYGWILFAVCIWPVFWYGVRLERHQGISAAPAPAVDFQAELPTRSPWQATVTAGVLAAILLLAPAALQRTLARGGTAGSLPAAFERGDSEGYWLQGEGPLLPGADEALWTVEALGQPVWVYRAWDRLGAVSGDWPWDGEVLLDRRWEPDRRIPIAGAEVGGVSYQQHQGRLRGTAVLLRSGLRVGGSPVNSDRERKLALLRGILALRQDALLWIAVTPCHPDCATAGARLDQWIQDNGPSLGGSSPATR